MNEKMDLLNTRQVAERLGVAPLSVRRWAIAGKLPAFKFGRDYNFRPSDVDAFIEASRVGLPVAANADAE